MIPCEDLKKVSTPYFEALIQSSKKVIEGGWYVLGKAIESFEKEFSKLHNGFYSLGISSELDALDLRFVTLDFTKSLKFWLHLLFI